MALPEAPDEVATVPGAATASAGLAGKWLGFLLHFAAAGALLPQALHWDGIGFLQWARDLHLRDYGHFLYAPSIRLSYEVLAPFGASIELAAQVLSAAAASLAFVLLWARFERLPVPTPLAIAAAAAVTTSPLLWRQAGVIEPSTLTLAALLAAFAAAEACGRRRSPGRLMVLGAATLLCIGYHVVSLLAVPWLLYHARFRARAVLLPLGAGLALALLVLALPASRAELLGFADFGRGFLPEVDGPAAVFTAVGHHVRHGRDILREGAPLVCVLGALVVLVAARGDRRSLLGAALLAGPPLLAFLAFGKPVVALLLPVVLTMGLLAGAGLRELARWRGPRAAALLLLPPALAFQATWSLLEAFHASSTPDRNRLAAEAVAGALPPSSVVFAGPLARHLEWFTDVSVVALPDWLHGAAAPADPVQGMLVEAGGLAPRAVYVTSEGLEYLVERGAAAAEQLDSPDRVRIPVGRSPGDFLLQLAP